MIRFLIVSGHQWITGMIMWLGRKGCDVYHAKVASVLSAQNATLVVFDRI
jgi:hypothetical protein